jgi:nicotinamidase-related amidase
VSRVISREEWSPLPLLKEESGTNNSAVALLLIDVINDLDFDQADDLLAQALPRARKIATLKREAEQLQVPTVYVNDNFGQW